MSHHFDLVVIGAGPGGYVAARRGAQLGLRTALVEKDQRLGGTCLLRGCIPTKALIQAAEVWHLCHKGARSFGVTTEGAAFDWARVLKRKEMATTKGAKGVEMLLQEAQVTVIQGTARLAGPNQVQVSGADGTQVLAADKIILATGSTTASLPGMQPDGERILTSDHLLDLPAVPPSLVVLGAGAVGLELATVMQTFGCHVTLVELMDQVLPLEDPECAAEVQKALARLQMKVLTGSKAVGVEKTASGVSVRIRDMGAKTEQTVDASALLVAVGRKPVTRDLGLDTVQVVTDRRGFIQVDRNMETATPGLYAVGDIVPTPQLAHLASHEALVAAGHAAGRPEPPVRYHAVPSCTYSNPEVASVGLGESAARERGHLVQVGKFPFSALGKASILGQPGGFIKVVADAETGQVLGVHMVGPRVTELIAEATMAVGQGLHLDSWIETIHPHPTLSEALGEAVLAAAGRPLHGA